MDPQDLAARIVAIHSTLASLNARATKVVAAIGKAKAELEDIAGQRQDLVTEIDQLMQPMLVADWQAAISPSDAPTPS